MLRVNNQIAIPEEELQEQFIRASGPGGQNVNKVSTAVKLQFDVEHSPSLPLPVRKRLKRLAGNRISDDGVLTIDARQYRKREQNREDARNRLLELIRQAAKKPKPRLKTKPTRASRERRLESKRRKSRIKKLRNPVRRKDD